MWGYLVTLVVAVTSITCNDFILKGDVIPRSYDLKFTYDMNVENGFPYFGVATIEITALKSTSTITLHAKEYEVATDNITLHGSIGEHCLEDVQRNTNFDFLTMKFDRPLEKDGEFTLVIPFSGNLAFDLDGVYISSYVDKKSNVKEYLIATQFEAISARKGFPCFDEPMYKAKYNINIGHNKDYTAISNMPLKSSCDKNAMEKYWSWDTMNEKFKAQMSDFVWDQFELSVPMSTYLVAFVVSKFQYKQSSAAVGGSETSFRIWARGDAIDQTEYASRTGPKVLAYYEKWFNVSFPLPKQDMIAIPDFSAGAMENWGLVTYRETALLYDPTQATLGNKERVAEVIAHELAHQWFGNLVTMKWWSDLWLNEGFATYMSNLGSAEAEPEWNLLDVEAAQNILIVLNKDSLATSHPVSVNFDDPRRISEIFDEISYRKGSALVRMMTKFLGEEVFREGLTEYLVTYSYKNAEQDDLWRELTKVSEKHNVLERNVTVKEIMDTWTKQTGYPILTVKRDYNDNSMTVKQDNEIHKESWWVPLNIITSKDVQTSKFPVQWLSASEGVKEAFKMDSNAGKDDWVLFNADLIAPYRVNYDKNNWDLLISTLNSDRFDTIPMLNRFQLIADIFEFAWSGIMNYERAIQLAGYLQRESNYLPMDTGLSALSKIDHVLLRTSDYGAFQKFVRKIITPAFERLGGLNGRKGKVDNDLLSEKMQAMISRWACRVKVPGCEETAIEMFQQWAESENDDDNPMPAGVRGTALCAGVARGGPAAWRAVLARAASANVASTRAELLAALCCSRDVWTLRQYIEWTISNNTVIRRQDAGLVMMGVALNPVGFYVAKDFVYERIEDIYQTFNKQGRTMGSLIKSVVTGFTQQKELDFFIKWREENKDYLQETKLTLDGAVELAQININWLKNNRKIVIDKMREFTSYDDEHNIEPVYLAANRHNNFNILYLCVILLLL